MGNYEQLKQAVADVIKTNGNQEITGEILQNALLSIISTIGTNATFAGIATPTTNPGTPDQNVFYIASENGTYSNFGSIILSEEVAILSNKGSSWVKSSTGIATSAKVTELEKEVIYDVTTNNNGATFASLSELLSDENLSTLIPISVRCGGMSIRFVQSSDNKYVQARCMAQNFTTDVTQWQGVDDEPTTGSNNLVKSGGVASDLGIFRKSGSVKASASDIDIVGSRSVMGVPFSDKQKTVVIDCPEGGPGLRLVYFMSDGTKMYSGVSNGENTIGSDSVYPLGFSLYYKGGSGDLTYNITIYSNLNAISRALLNNYEYVGILASRSESPITTARKIFYIATITGVYPNFGNLNVPQGINILKYDGNAWSQENIYGVDDMPTPGSQGLVKSSILGHFLGYYEVSKNLPASSSDKTISDAILLDKDDLEFAVKAICSTSSLRLELTYTDNTKKYIALHNGDNIINVSDIYSLSYPKQYRIYLKGDNVADNVTLAVYAGASYKIFYKNANYLNSWNSLSLKYSNGFYNISNNGIWEDGGRRTTEKIGVKTGDIYRINSTIGNDEAALITLFDINESYIGYEKKGVGAVTTISDYIYSVPDGVSFIAVYSNNGNPPSVDKLVSEEKYYPKSNTYSKEQVDSFIEGNGVDYGLYWNIDDPNDLGNRCFGAVGKTATIGIGNTNGSSDFDNIYPWSEMKRCNITINANGSHIMTYEGENGFALDGSNGDVFVRIPKFGVNKYKKNGNQYVVISPNAPTHPAFIEDGKEIDEIFVGAFEGYKDANGKLHSISGVVPTSNEIPADFLTFATANGKGYSLYDMRTVDAIFCLFAVEFGCRNTNHILGYGIADYFQAVSTYHSLYNETNTNEITVDVTSLNNSQMRVGTNIIICQNNDQTDILAIRKITNKVVNGNWESITFTFDGTPLNIDTSCFCGSAAQDTNWCESCGNEYKLNWHTGRASMPAPSNLREDCINPMRYRWVENIIGNLWHLLPDVTFNNRQMYICESIKNYEFFKHTSPYRPIGDLLPLMTDNGEKPDVPGNHHWIKEILYDTFAKGNNFGKDYDVNLLSTQAFGGHYYLADGTVIIANGGGFDHLYRCNICTNRAWILPNSKWYLYGVRIIYKNLNPN